jgi:hypothetical protein
MAYRGSLERCFVVIAVKANVAVDTSMSRRKEEETYIYIYIYIYNSGIRDEVPTAVLLRIHVFWHMTLCRCVSSTVRKNVIFSPLKVPSIPQETPNVIASYPQFRNSFFTKIPNVNYVML